MPATTKVRELWCIYSANLKLHLPRTLGDFLCPICLRYFETTVLEKDVPCVISEGHILPQAMGGKEVTLECRECNNSLGTEVDSSLAAENSWHQFEQQGGERRATIETAEGRRPVTVKQVGSEITIQESHKSPLPGARSEESIKKLLDQPFNLKFNAKFNPEKIPLAVFHSAFLMMFRLIGYEYVVSVGGRAVSCWLRNQLLPDGISHAFQTLKSRDVLPLKDDLIGVATIGSMRCFAVPIPVVDQETRRLVFLPAFEQSDYEAYMSTFNGASGAMSLRVRQVGEHPPICSLADEAFKEFGHLLFAEANRVEPDEVGSKDEPDELSQRVFSVE